MSLFFSVISGLCLLVYHIFIGLVYVLVAVKSSKKGSEVVMVVERIRANLVVYW